MDRSLFKDFVPILLKYFSNFGVRDLSKLGDAMLDGYLQEIFNFTIAAYKVPSASFKLHASKLNHMWHRILFETINLQVSC